ncbi:uridine kinase [Clostridium sp. AL.422]|uniref:uridine kinase family protein n=1 Tax=Clostridium TaxID=1485 RepID=UPI00293DC996|nr:MULTISPECIES: uridine kinase [unclassified Clostridium]MDV4152702.1 uridine kinase [Clostridium sp. AL.422]
MIDKIINKIKENIAVKQFCLVAIDGASGSGKSTLAEHITSKYGSGQIIHMDDLYKPSNERIHLDISKKESGADYDIKRLSNDIIIPIINGIEGKYQRYDWDMDKLAEWHTVKPKGLIIFEGVYSISNQLYNEYDIKIFVECNRELRLKRGLERDGESALDFWKQWMLEEDKYFQEQKPKDKSDFIILGEEKY